MGLLGNIYSAADGFKRQLRGLLSDPMGTVEQMGGILADDAKTTAARNARMVHQPETITPQDVNATMASALNFAPLGMTVWHGSPHKFTKFDMSKIGTGEGAQAYGHGLYVAESPSVAKEYAGANAGRAAASEGAIDALPKPVQMEVFKAMQMKDSPFKKAALDDIVSRYPEAASVIQSKNPTLYKVDIPDEAVAKFLDWDKPLSQQSAEVISALERSKSKHVRSMMDYARTPYPEAIGGDEKTMGEAFRLLNLNLQGKSSADSVKASALLAKQGIPGIRYLDGGSRSAGQGSSNFVLFDDQMPRILEINGQATGNVPWKPGEWGLLK